MKTLEELIQHIERSIELSYIMAHRMYEMTALHLTVRDAIDLLPGLKQAQSERQQSVKSDRTMLNEEILRLDKELEAARAEMRDRNLTIEHLDGEIERLTQALKVQE